MNVSIGYGEQMESGHYQAILEHKAVGNQVSSVLLLLTELFIFKRSVSMPQRSQKAFFFCGQSLSFLSGGFGLYSEQEKRNRFV